MIEIEKPSKMGLNMNFYSEEAKTTAKPNDTEYGFLYERNKKYMNNIAITFGGLKVTYEELHTKILLDSGSLYRIVKKRLRWKQMDAAETILNSLNPRDIGKHMIGSHMEARIGT